MKIYNYKCALLVVVLVQMFVFSAESKIVIPAAFRSLISESDRSRIEKKISVCKVRERSESVWPEVICFSLLDTTPLEAAAFFYDLEYQKRYIPNMVESVITEAKKANEIHAFYRIKMPWPLSDMRQVTKNTLRELDKGQYSIAWKQMSSNFTNEIEGQALFCDHQGKTLFIYSNFVIPKLRLASFFESKAINDMKLTYEKIIGKINKSKRINTPLINEQVVRLRHILNGKNIYLEILQKRK